MELLFSLVTFIFAYIMFKQSLKDAKKRKNIKEAKNTTQSLLVDKSSRPADPQELAALSKLSDTKVKQAPVYRLEGPMQLTTVEGEREIVVSGIPVICTERALGEALKSGLEVEVGLIKGIAFVLAVAPRYNLVDEVLAG